MEKLAGLSTLPTTTIESLGIFLLLLFYLGVGTGSPVVQGGLKLLIGR